MDTSSEEDNQHLSLYTQGHAASNSVNTSGVCCFRNLVTRSRKTTCLTRSSVMFPRILQRSLQCCRAHRFPIPLRRCRCARKSRQNTPQVCDISNVIHTCMLLNIDALFGCSHSVAHFVSTIALTKLLYWMDHGVLDTQAWRTCFDQERLHRLVPDQANGTSTLEPPVCHFLCLSHANPRSMPRMQHPCPIFRPLSDTPPTSRLTSVRFAICAGTSVSGRMSNSSRSPESCGTM
jgi:hypothetical protein